MGTPSDPFPLITVEGPPRERGRQYGAAAQDRIANSIAVYMDAWISGEVGSRDEVYRRARQFGGTIGDRFPELYEEITGIAEGSGRDLEEIIALNARTELLFAEGVMDEGCTAAVILPEASGGRTLIGQNWDWKAQCSDLPVVLRVRPEKGPAFLTFVEAGILARHGLNDAGIGTCGAFLGCDHPPQAGIPIALMRRAVLQSGSFPAAIGQVVRSPHSFASNHVLAHRDGEAIDLEMTPDNVFPMYATDGILTHSNHFVAGLGHVRDTGIALFPDSLYRHRRLRRRLEEQSRPLTITGFQAALGDHFGHPHSVCRHPDDSGRSSNADPRADIVTVASVVMDLTESRMWVAAGPPCETPYTAYSLDEETEGLAADAAE